MIPDGERVVSNFIREHPDVQEITASVSGGTPADIEQPWVRVTQLGAPNDPSSPVEHLIAFLIQLDCYAGGKDGTAGEGGQPQAKRLARVVRAALTDDLPGAADLYEDTIVTSARIVGHTRVPDTEIQPARERVTLTARVHMHP